MNVCEWKWGLWLWFLYHLHERAIILSRWLLLFHLPILLCVTSWQSKRHWCEHVCYSTKQLAWLVQIFSHIFLILKCTVSSFYTITSTHHKQSIRMSVKGTIIFKCQWSCSPLNAKSAIFILFPHSKQIHLMWSPRWCFFSPLGFSVRKVSHDSNKAFKVTSDFRFLQPPLYCISMKQPGVPANV